jgi:O-glycosyl hydrolase
MNRAAAGVETAAQAKQKTGLISTNTAKTKQEMAGNGSYATTAWTTYNSQQQSTTA